MVSLCALPLNAHQFMQTAAVSYVGVLRRKVLGRRASTKAYARAARALERESKFCALFQERPPAVGVVIVRGPKRPELHVHGSGGTFVAVRQRCPALPVMVLVRPRAGDFCFSPEEVEAMETDIRLFRQHGASGFVLGALTRDGDVDVPTCRRLLAAAGPDADTTFHRAFDVARAPEAALERVVELGFRRLLTSGQAASVEQGMELIGRLERQAAGRIQLMPGGGVSESNVARLLQVTQVRAVHASASKPVPLPDAAVSFGEHRICSSERVRALLSIIRAQQPL
ncbi:PF03932 family protein CutC isoform X4 [Haemaphysalis longicornis]